LATLRAGLTTTQEERKVVCNLKRGGKVKQSRRGGSTFKKFRIIERTKGPFSLITI